MIIYFLVMNSKRCNGCFNYSDLCVMISIIWKNRLEGKPTLLKNQNGL